MSDASFDPNAFGELFGQIDSLKRQLAELASPESVEVEGSAAAGRVRVRVRGGHHYEAVHIDPSLLDQGDVTLLEDLMLVALRDANEMLEQARERALDDTLKRALAGLGDVNPAALSSLAQAIFAAEEHAPDEDDEAPDED